MKPLLWGRLFHYDRKLWCLCCGSKILILSQSSESFYHTLATYTMGPSNCVYFWFFIHMHFKTLDACFLPPTHGESYSCSYICPRWTLTYNIIHLRQQCLKSFEPVSLIPSILSITGVILHSFQMFLDSLLSLKLLFINIASRGLDKSELALTLLYYIWNQSQEVKLVLQPVTFIIN